MFSKVEAVSYKVISYLVVSDDILNMMVFYIDNDAHGEQQRSYHDIVHVELFFIFITRGNFICAHNIFIVYRS